MFERYTMQARRAVFYALANAVHRNADKIGAADLLSGLASQDSSRANEVAPLKDRIVDVFATMGLPKPCTAMPDLTGKDLPLDREAKLSLMNAAEEADNDSQPGIDTDHLLRGILRSTNETSAALQSIGISLDSARAASKRMQAQCGPSTPAT